jgi:DHA1 family bicyclomycin/chloramphenicol resistance-like MFS transporter
MTSVTDGRRTMGRRQLTTLLAMLMSMAALGVDIILPAFADIRADFGLATDSTAVAGLVTTYFLGMAVGQIPYGVLSDRFGRKPIVFTGLTIYVTAAVASTFAPNFGLLLLARFVWGLGAAGSRTITLSIVRDTHEAEKMAKVMSFIVAMFLLIPVVAPSIGAVMTNWVGWRGAVVFSAVVAVAVGLWSVRLPETLHPEHRLGLNWRAVMHAGRQVVTNRMTVGYMFAVTVLFASIVTFIGSSEIIIGDVFGLADQFPLIFGGVAVFMGIAALVNGALVERVGLERLLGIVMILYVTFALGLFGLALVTDGKPAFWLFATGLVLVTSLFALLMPNLNTAAMMPMGKIAGTASAVIGTVVTAGGSLLGSVIDRAYNGTVTPFTLGFLIFGLAAWGLSRWASGGFTRVVPEPLPAPAE